MTNSLYVVVVGCGRLGSMLANELSQAGHRVVVVDRSQRAFEKLSAESFSGYRVEGDASQPSVLRRARAERADLLIAATREDNLNLMVSLVALRVFGVRHVMARVYDPRRAGLYHEFGVETVCPTSIAAAAFRILVAQAQDQKEGSR